MHALKILSYRTGLENHVIPDQPGKSFVIPNRAEGAVRSLLSRAALMQPSRNTLLAQAQNFFAVIRSAPI
jgi:hypothetical protein